MGKILIVKSLAISRIVHFLIALPTPKHEFFRELNKKLYHYIWNHKPPKIKKTTLELDIKDGGLKMINLENFDKTLKVKWIKTLQEGRGVRTKIPEKYQIDKIPKYGPKYLLSLQKTCKNWISVINAVISYQKIFSKHNQDPSILEEPLWYNSKINSHFIRKWDSAGLRIVGYIIDSDLNYKSKVQIETEYGLNLNCIDYAALIRSIPQQELFPLINTESLFLPWCQEYIRSILSDTKQRKTIKNIFSLENDTIPTSKNKWQNEILFDEREGNWEFRYRVQHSCIRDVNLKMFQYKILHRILATNKKLFQYGIKNSNLCDYCGIETESTLHLFCECDISSSIWQQVVDWLNT